MDRLSFPHTRTIGAWSLRPTLRSPRFLLPTQATMAGDIRQAFGAKESWRPAAMDLASGTHHDAQAWMVNDFLKAWYAA